MGGGLWGALAGAGLGAMQYGDKKRQQEHDKQVASETARYSPWTGMKPQAVEAAPSLLGTVGQGALGGFSFGQQFGGGDAAAAPQAAPDASAVPQAPQAPGYGLQGLNQMQNPWALKNTSTQFPVA